MEVPVIYPEAYVRFLIHFHTDRDLFECHEVLEQYWKEHPNDPRKPLWHGLIQLAVGLYHERRGNLNGALKMLQSAALRLTDPQLSALGLDALSFSERLAERLNALQHKQTVPYRDMNLPIRDQHLLQACLNRCAELGLRWGAESAIDNFSLIHRHSLRDRSDVINTRAAELEKRKALN